MAIVRTNGVLIVLASLSLLALSFRVQAVSIPCDSALYGPYAGGVSVQIVAGVPDQPLPWSGNNAYAEGPATTTVLGMIGQVFGIGDDAIIASQPGGRLIYKLTNGHITTGVQPTSLYTWFGPGFDVRLMAYDRANRLLLSTGAERNVLVDWTTSGRRDQFYGGGFIPGTSTYVAIAADWLTPINRYGVCTSQDDFGGIYRCDTSACVPGQQCDRFHCECSFTPGSTYRAGCAGTRNGIFGTELFGFPGTIVSHPTDDAVFYVVQLAMNYQQRTSTTCAWLSPFSWTTSEILVRELNKRTGVTTTALGNLKYVDLDSGFYGGYPHNTHMIVDGALGFSWPMIRRQGVVFPPDWDACRVAHASPGGGIVDGVPLANTQYYGSGACGGDDGDISTASFDHAAGLLRTPEGHLLVLDDRGRRLRLVDRTRNQVCTLASNLFTEAIGLSVTGHASWSTVGSSFFLTTDRVVRKVTFTPAQPAGYCVSDVDCGTPGSGSCNLGTNRCQCNPGIGGANCQCRPVETCGGHGECNADGTCRCHPNWSGTRCDVCAPNWIGPNCGTWSPTLPCTAPNQCSGHGICQGSVCLCSGHWAQPDCSTCVPGFTGANCDQVSTNTPGGGIACTPDSNGNDTRCGLHGVCTRVNNTNSFVCRCHYNCINSSTCGWWQDQAGVPCAVFVPQ